MSTPRRLVAFFDGACSPNPGGVMGAGAVITENDAVIFQAVGMAGDGELSSNNTAEYGALIALLCYLVAAGLNDASIEIRGDSRLVIEQMRGAWRIRKGLYAAAAEQALQLLPRFSNIHFKWIPREDNTLADGLSKIGITGTV
jgi:ribonuclease HI